MLPASAGRVAPHTNAVVERRLQHEFEDRLAYFAEHPEMIASRLEELGREWDIERAIEANASTLALGFLLQHSLQGWCPPVPVLRRLGFRTAREIERERYALKAMRGDFNGVEQAQNKVMAALRAVGGSLMRGRNGG